ncbi:MAG: RNA polymerase sigma factor [Ignavibacteriaceae bacterium]|nr:RNA polymerase sigma factor [Ignavibacteriaceae bacterium]
MFKRYLLVNWQATKDLTDLDLVELSKNGNQSAFMEIVKRHKSKVASTIYGMVGKCDEADDIGQEVFIRFYKSINNFRGESALGTYLTRIAINLSLNEIARQKRKRFFSFDKMLEDGSDLGYTDKTNTLNENKEIIEKAVQKMDAKYRAVLVLRLIDGYSTEETAKILNIPLGTVLSRLARAQSKLKEYLQPYFSEL